MADIKALKICDKCGLEAHTEEDLKLFSKDKSKTYGRRNRCAVCRNKETSKTYYKNKDKYAKYARKKHLKNKYGLSLEEYDMMLKAQDNKCEICSTHISQLDKPLYIDHCHHTGSVRGLLCQKCNSAIGLLNDDLELVVQAAAYLSKYKEAK